MVFDHKILPVRNEAINSIYGLRGFSKKRKPVSRRLKKNRRKSTYDRRKSLRDGVIVSLSFDRNRRRIVDRRNISEEKRIPHVSDHIVA